jgi:hypothetical protein
MAVRRPVRTEAAGWTGFIAWMGVGAVVSLSTLIWPTVGLLILATVTVVAVSRPSTRRGASGGLAGAGLPLLYVAWVNRSGPGNICTYTPTSTSCGQQYDPWPWLIAGLVLITVGIVAHVLHGLRG